MKYFIDSEFYEKPNTITLISLAIVAEDGRELYHWNRDCGDEPTQVPWLAENVFPFQPAPGSNIWINQNEFKSRIIEFIGNDTNPEFWGYYCDYDWVIFCWQFGRMVDLPKHFPMFCLDLKQLIVRAGNPIITKQAEGVHDALADAKWIKGTYFDLTKEGRASCAQESPAE